MSRLTSNGAEKQLIRNAVGLAFAQHNHGLCVMLDVVGGCLDSWLDAGVFIHRFERIVLVNDDPTECRRLRSSTAKRLAHTSTEVTVVCSDLYSYISSLPESSVSALFCDHNQSVSYLEKVECRDKVQRACMDGAYVAITASLRVRESEFRLTVHLKGLGTFSGTPITYNTNGPMCFVSGRVCKERSPPITPTNTTAQKRRLAEDDRDELETMLRRSKSRPFSKADLQPGSLIECGSRNDWLYVISKRETITHDLFDVKSFRHQRVMHTFIDINEVKRVAPDVRKEIFLSGDDGLVDAVERTVGERVHRARRY